MKKFKFVVWGKRNDGKAGSAVKELLKAFEIDNHNVFMCEHYGVGIQHMSLEQVQKALELVYENFSGLTVKIAAEN